MRLKEEIQKHQGIGMAEIEKGLFDMSKFLAFLRVKKIAVHYESENRARKPNEDAAKDLLEEVCSNVLLNPENYVQKIQGD